MLVIQMEYMRLICSSKVKTWGKPTGLSLTKNKYNNYMVFIFFKLYVDYMNKCGIL